MTGMALAFLKNYLSFIGQGAVLLSEINPVFFLISFNIKGRTFAFVSSCFIV
jgi:hypothetical protein